MKPTISAGLQVLVASLVFASAHARAADASLAGQPEIIPVAFVAPARDRYGAHAPTRADGRGVALSTELDPDPILLTDDWLDGSARDGQKAVRLYPIGGNAGTEEGTGATAPPAAAKHAAQDVSESKKVAPPRPGWALILAGLLGVGAIARRRMSA